MQFTEGIAPDTTGASTKDRGNAPVFVLGCGRSGTTLLYHMILSAGGFAVYRAESNVINLLEPRFGNLSIRRNREKLMDAWINSKLFRVSGLNADEIRNKVLQECRNGGDFLRIIMGGMARHQGVRRWADCTPEHLLYMSRIKETIPDALIIHIIRDGRDVALSTDKLGYIKRAPWDNWAVSSTTIWITTAFSRSGSDLSASRTRHSRQTTGTSTRSAAGSKAFLHRAWRCLKVWSVRH